DAGHQDDAESAQDSHGRFLSGKSRRGAMTSREAISFFVSGRSIFCRTPKNRWAAALRTGVGCVRPFRLTANPAIIVAALFFVAESCRQEHEPCARPTVAGQPVLPLLSYSW